MKGRHRDIETYIEKRIIILGPIHFCTHVHTGGSAVRKYICFLRPCLVRFPGLTAVPCAPLTRTGEECEARYLGHFSYYLYVVYMFL